MAALRTDDRMGEGRPRLIILGTGFGGFSLLKRIDVRRYDVIVVSPRNHFLFTPLLPSTTVGTIEFRSIIEPVREAEEGATYYFASCVEIDPAAREIVCEGVLDHNRFRLRYDDLVLAVGAANQTFGIPGVEGNVFFLKELSDARAIRQSIIECLERASTPGHPESERERLAHFVVVGGGPTGVEFAGELHDFLREDLRKWYPALADRIRITIVEASPTILNTFDDELSAYALKLFQRDRIEVRTGAVVKAVKPGLVELRDGTSLAAGLVVWATGIGPTPLAQGLPFEMNERGRILVDENLQVKGQPHIYALGDAAVVDTNRLPPTAQVAQQQGKFLARLLNARLDGRELRPFTFRNLGMLAYVGTNRALADLPHFKGRGFSTWLFWRSAYFTKLVSLKNKILVLFDWFKTTVFGRDISRF